MSKLHEPDSDNVSIVTCEICHGTGHLTSIIGFNTELKKQIEVVDDGKKCAHCGGYGEYYDDQLVPLRRIT